ncbi:putative gustatory receptor 94a [Eurosta solidaginis]|uniref:putative gustatory receptor 94a n=1 Tax=Eurosta solidaginis TaxID=178769 RepID=UPI003530A929
MQEYKKGKIVLNIVVISFMLFGLAAHYISLRELRFYNSKIITLYSLMIALTFTIIYGNSMWGDLQTNQWDLKNAVKLYSYMNIVASVINYLTAIILSRVFVCYFNSVQLFGYIKFFKISGKMVIDSVRIVFLKSFLIPTIYEATLVVQQIHNDSSINLLLTLHTLLPMIISQVFPNLFFIALVTCKMLMVTLNERLGEIVKEVNFMQSAAQMRIQKPYYRMQRYCELADRLDTLAQKYRLICQHTTKYVQLLAAPLIYSLLCNLCGITCGCFTQYLAIADTLVNNEPYDVFNVIINAVFLGISIIEVLLQGQISNENRLKVQETGIILQRIKLTHADERFKQAVEEFSLLILVVKYKIQPFGLLEINISLVQHVISAVTSFLLILVQSDLTQRFSLL